MMRKDQIKILETLIEAHGFGPAVQLIMGAGKTDVLQRVLAAIFGSGESLSSIIIPKSLRPMVISRLQLIMGPAFDRLITCLPFNREHLGNLNTLKNMRALLEEA